MKECDVLVVGAGPAGSSAARAASMGGAKTVFIDKKGEVGKPVQCAGAVGAYLLPFLPFEIPKELLIWRIDELRFWADGIAINRRGGPWTSYAIDRSSFDSWLAQKAVEAGADLRLETELVDLEIEDDFHASKAIVKTGEGEEEAAFKALIAADGVDSKVLEELGVRNDSPIIGNAMSYELENVKLQAPHRDQLFFGDFAPSGYAYLFPISRDRANIGVGSISDEKEIEKCFEEFCELPQVKRQIQDSTKVKEKSGSVPFGYLADKCWYGNVLLAGDAATQNIKPLVEGILPAIICGSIAGETAAKFLETGSPLAEYQESVQRKLGVIFRESDRYIDLLDELSHSTSEGRYLMMMGLCSNIFSVEDIKRLKDEDYAMLKRRLMGWKKSKMKRFMTEVQERFGILYLRLVSR
ncbi:MAG: geranylgeranyl reductase family protein [Candidatus Hydrothermarchaeales archaeon]